MFIFNHVKKKYNHFSLKLTLERRITPVSVFLGLVWLFIFKYFFQSRSDKFAKQLLSLVALSLCWSLDASDVSATISDTFSTSSKSLRDPKSNVGLLLALIIAKLKRNPKKKKFSLKKFHRQWRQLQQSLRTVHIFFIRC